MAGNFMNKAVTPQPTRKVGGIKKPNISGIKPKIKPKQIKEAPTFKEVQEEMAHSEEVSEQASEPIVEQSSEPIVEEVKQEVEIPTISEEDDDKFEDKIIEEITEEVNKEEPIKETKEEEPEGKPKTKKRTRKKAKKESSDTVSVTDAEPLDVEDYDEYMYEVIRPTIPEWEEEKEEIRDKMSTLNLDPNMNPKEIRQLLADLTDMHKEIQDRLEEAKTNLDNTTEKIKTVEIKAAAGGSNAEERKLKALIAKENYIKEGETHSVNLIVFKQLLNERVLFYNSQLNTLEYNKFLVMTFQKVCSTENKGF